MSASVIARLEHVARTLALAATFVGLAGASPDHGPIDIQTSGLGQVTAVPDHLFVEILISPRGDSSPDVTVTQDDIRQVRERLAGAGLGVKFVAFAGLETQSITGPSPQAEAFEEQRGFSHFHRTNFNRTFGVVMLRFDRPATGSLDDLSETALAGVGAWKTRDVITVRTSSPSYTMDSCTSNERARESAVASARAAALDVARSLGRSISADPPVIKNVGVGDRFYVCGPRALPAIFVPSGTQSVPFGAPPGRYFTESSVEVVSRTRGASGLRQRGHMEPERPDVGTIHIDASVDANASMAQFFAVAERQRDILANEIGLPAASLVRVTDPIVHGEPIEHRFDGWFRKIKRFGATYAQTDRVARPMTTYVSQARVTLHVPPERGRFEIFGFGQPNDADADVRRNRVMEALRASGFDPTGGNNVITVDVDAPTRDMAEQIRDAVFVADTGTHIEAFYYIDDCRAGDEPSIAAAALSAHDGAIAWANAQKMNLGPVVAASLDAGSPKFCGGFAYGSFPAPDDAVDPYVAIETQLTLVYAVTSPAGGP